MVTADVVFKAEIQTEILSSEFSCQYQWTTPLGTLQREHRHVFEAKGTPLSIMSELSYTSHMMDQGLGKV